MLRRLLRQERRARSQTRKLRERMGVRTTRCPILLLIYAAKARG